MKKNFLLLAFGWILGLNAAAQTFTLTVNNGYGSGNYSAGDTVDIWSEAIPITSSFDKWTGDVATMESQDEWHTTLVMPASNIAVTANQKTIGSISINYEKIMGRDTLKNVYSYFPVNFKGVIFCFHGTGGSASNWVNSLEYRQFLNDAIADTFAFIITEAEEITKQTDFNQDGKLRWGTYPIDTINNVDYANIKVLMDTFRLRGITNSATRYFAVGMSNGGNFSPAIATAFGWKAAVSYCASSAQGLMNITTVPVQWCMAKYDNNDNVGPQGNADALVNSNTLNGRGICTKYFLHNHSPVYAERFMRSGSINQTLANNLFAEFQTNQLLDANNYLRFASDSIGAKISAAPSAYPVFLSLNGSQRIFVASEVDAMFAAHQFYSDYNKKTLRFFDKQCDTTAIVNGVVGVNNAQELLSPFPNPVSSTLQLAVPSQYSGAELLIQDMYGKELFKTKVAEGLNSINVNTLSSGVYILRLGAGVGKFIKE